MSLSSFPRLFTLKLALVRVGPKGRKSLQGDVQNYCSSLVLQQVLRFREASTVLLSHQQHVFSQPYCCCGIDFIVSLLALLQAERSPPTSLFLNRPLHAVGECLLSGNTSTGFLCHCSKNTVSFVVCKLACMFGHTSLHFLLLDTSQVHSFSFFTTTISFLSWNLYPGPLPCFWISLISLYKQTLIKFSVSLMYSAVYPDCSV